MSNLSAALTSRMNFLIERQGVVAGNIANANTPGYLSRDLIAKKPNSASSSFGMAVTNAQHMSAAKTGSTTGTMTEDSRFIQHNGNSVRIDEEMLKMTDAQLNYRMMTEIYTKQVTMQKSALGQR